MFARLRSRLFAVNASYWFYPALFSIASFVVALVLIRLDRSGATAPLIALAGLEPAGPGSASTVLSVIAGSVIGVASTVFSITIAAVVYASGTYGPRLLINFLEDKVNQVSLAMFVGTFVFAITVLREVRAESAPGCMGAACDPVPQFAFLCAFGLMIVAVGVLVYFLHHIPASIRINAVIEGVGNNLLEVIDERHPDPFQPGAIPPAQPSGAEIAADETGYIRVIDFGELERIAALENVRIGLGVRTGDFLHEGKALCRLDTDQCPPGLAQRIRDCFAVGVARTLQQDIEFSMDELVEIALRALSPAVNDPFTAINAIHWLGAATGTLGQRDLWYGGNSSPPEACGVIPLEDDFDHYLRRGFGAARGAVATSQLAAMVAFETLQSTAGMIADEQRRAMVWQECDLLLDQARLALSGPALEAVERKYCAVRRSEKG